jgi:hypothetical protein
MKNFLFILITFFSLLSCKKGHWCDCIETAGNLTSDSISFENFDTIAIEDVFTIYLTQDSVNYAIIETGENIIENVTFNNENRTLTIDNQHQCLWTKPKKNDIILHLHYKYIEKIIVNETSQLICVNEIMSDEIGIIFKCRIAEAKIKLNSNIFYFWNLNGGVLELEGNVDVLKIWNFALCTVKAEMLKSKNVIIENHSLCNCYVNAQEILEGGIFNKGNIYYRGNPSVININIEEDSGSLIKIE